MAFKKEQLSAYPNLPGVYLMKDRAGRVIYVGKAKNLQKRLKQYFTQHQTRPTTWHLVQKIFSIEAIVVASEKEALLLENTLIKKEKPKYNLLLKDDKTYVCLMLTSHKWPRLKLARVKKYQKNQEYFGPYTNASAAKETLDLILRLFPLRQCADSELKNRRRECLLYDLKKCLAPCTGRCTLEEYQLAVQRARALLKGENQSLFKELTGQMHFFSQKQQYEKAAAILKLIEQLKHISEKQHVENLKVKNVDALGFYQQKEKALIALFRYRESHLTASRSFAFELIFQSPEELLENFLLQYYLKEKIPPKMILLPFALKSQKHLESLLCRQLNAKLKLVVPQKGEKRFLLKAALKNAAELFQKEQKLAFFHKQTLLSLQKKLKLRRYPKEVLVFDASHLFETERVATLVSFNEGQKSHHLLFKIKTPLKGDLRALEEVLKRYLGKDRQLPDLLLLDGGRAHLNLALKVFKQNKLASPDMIALAKEKARHDKGLRHEAIYLPDLEKPFFFPPDAPELLLIQKMRDESHRVALAFYRKLSLQKIKKSLLDQIPGIGEKKKKALLLHFQSLEKIKTAALEELKEVRELNAQDLKRIYAFFHVPPQSEN
ncbi:MAG: excinuclease ABC subunit UvrC [Parachlamydiales bacterium]|jgi:excinuclease ABC subunit C